jgi:hypothetical protein
MKINFKNPRTGKPSTVAIPDIWVLPFEMSFGCSLPGEYPWSNFVQCQADIYFSDSPCNPPGTSPKTFTAYCETVMARKVTSVVSLSDAFRSLES